MTKTGDVLTEVVLPSCGPATVDARQAAAEAIAAHLFGLTFRKGNGDDLRAPTSSFQLRAVQREWPEPGTKLDYPCASIIDLGMGSFAGANFAPVCLEETVDVHGPGTVLWEIDELEADFQVDFFTDDKPTREAIAAALPSAFSPGESFGVILQCSERYYRASCRASLLYAIREDDSATAYVRERRLRTTVRVQVPVLDLRASRRADFSATLAEVGPQPPIATNADEGC